MIKVQRYPIKNLLLNADIISLYIDKFWTDIFSHIHRDDSPKHLYILCKVLFTERDMGYRTLGHLVKVNFKDKELYIHYIQERLGLFVDTYKSIPIKSIEFSYIEKLGEIGANEERALFKNESDLSTHKFNNKNLPISMDPNDYGTIILSNTINNHNSNSEEIRYVVTHDLRTYQIEIKKHNTNTYQI